MGNNKTGKYQHGWRTRIKAKKALFVIKKAIIQ